MTLNRKSRTTLKFTGKSWGIKFLSKREKNSLKPKVKKKSKSELNKTRFNLLINNFESIPDDETTKNLFEKFNSLDFPEKQKLRKSIKKRKSKLSLNELILKLDIANKKEKN